MVPGFGVWAECQSIGTTGKNQRACYLFPRGKRYVKNKGHNRNRLYLRAIHCPASIEKHYVQWFLFKSVQDVIVCEKNRFCLHESGWTKAWCPGLVSGPSAKAQELVTRIRGLVIIPGHHGLVRPDSRRQNLIFFTNRNILHTLKNEPLNIMLLHTSRRMDGL